MENNIEAFNVAVAEVFGRCYEAFPVRIQISIIEIGDAILEANGELDADIDLRKPTYLIAKESISWLLNAGYIWNRHASSTHFGDVTLSPKGLEVMNAIPAGITSQETLGELLSKGVKTIGKETALGIVKLSLAQGAKLVMGA